jgi:hypothetical protein
VGSSSKRQGSRRRGVLRRLRGDYVDGGPPGSGSEMRAMVEMVDRRGDGTSARWSAVTLPPAGPESRVPSSWTRRTEAIRPPNPPLQLTGSWGYAPGPRS